MVRADAGSSSLRELNRFTGRARVQSNMQNVLIITKARDNRLIKLTRELAVYLMSKQRRGSKRGLVVYVPLRISQRGSFCVDMSTDSCDDRNDSMQRGFGASIQNFLTPSRDVGHQVAQASRSLKIKTLTTRASFATGPVACAAKVLTYLTLSSRSVLQ